MNSKGKEAGFVGGYSWQIFVAISLFLLFALSAAAFADTYNFYFSKPNKKQAGQNQETNNESNDEEKSDASPSVAAAPAPAPASVPSAPIPAPSVVASPNGQGQVITIPPPAGQAQAPQPIVIHNINNNNVGVPGTNTNVTAPSTLTTTVAREAGPPPQAAPVTPPPIGEKSPVLSMPALPPMPVTPGYPSAPPAPLSTAPINTDDHEETGPALTASTVLERPDSNSYPWRLGVSALVFFGEFEYSYTSQGKTTSYGTREGTWGGLLALNKRFSKTLGLTLYGGARYSGPANAMKGMAGADLEFLPFRIPVTETFDLFQVGFIFGGSTAASAAENFGSLHVGARANLNFGSNFGVTAAGRANFGFLMFEAGLTAKL